MLGKKLHVKKNDTVVVTTGKDKSKSGKVLTIVPKKDGVIVEGINIVKRHTKARGSEQGGILEKEAPVHISNVALLCPKCNKPVRTKTTVLEDGKKARCCVKCGESFDK
ncbi:50S ribosomal protein L24 [Geomesophilobacter sediminis]|uniref:Large ribosomal subunit protein uL24 n=1 Tax=Geomesophilobacter sediminis TaxID=2798584 RepID=A0A8J7JE98_9BACT|nr:50S ribosomal protein L24 [Geomesophilobacter sediminis]MBJ6725843.1 50S ribosomal protein L24 [Geomesophilobacter sediminis]